jgi:hypothetical protein
LRRGVLLGLELGKVLSRGETAKGSVRSVVVIEVLEGIQDWVDGFDVSRQVVDGIELVSPGSIATLDGTVHFGDLGGKT